ncbi:MAG: FKBP-type peptidyl-prolyl cis-trans isomerase [Patescibacteria group bacterium]|nr:FKBP-type peptidyl-prolyl cis-trans isomerase [Patescibacteria group bacterium]MDE1966077.1 FKBP-type peptidyl-prolyl cis-trans isomerase [Patescibacteria group bacterium]
MNVTSTAVAVALALVVVIGVFVFGYPLFTAPQQAAQTGTQANAPADASAAAATTTATTSTNITPDMTAQLDKVTSLQVKDDVVGTGAVAAAGDSVTVNYVGALTNGTVFDASANHGSQGFTFTLGAGQVIKGWDEGVAGMKVGGKRTLIIPASLAYGSQGVSNVIPPNAVLIFQVELLKVQKAGQ